MSVKRYFDVPAEERKPIWVRHEEHAIVKNFAQQRRISMAEAIHLLISPALAAANGLDYTQALWDGGFLRTQPGGKPPGEGAGHSEA